MKDDCNNPYEAPLVERQEARQLAKPVLSALSLPKLLHYSLTAEEIKEAQSLSAGVVVEPPKYSIAYFVFAAVIIAVFSFLMSGSNALVYVIAGLVVIAIIAVSTARLRTKVRGVDHTVEQTDDVPCGQVEVVVDGLTLTVDGESSFLRSHTFTKLLESGSLLGLQASQLLFFVPKRVFETDFEISEFRSLVEFWISIDDKHSIYSHHLDAEADEDQVVASGRLEFRDYIDRTFASWIYRSILAGGVMLYLGTMVYASFLPAPEGAVYTDAEVFMYFVLPMLPVGIAIFASVFVVHVWWQEYGKRPQFTFRASPEGIQVVTPDDRSEISWGRSTHFKETWWAFYIWWPPSPGWVVVPKRLFESPDDVSHTRQLLDANATRSTWLWK